MAGAAPRVSMAPLIITEGQTVTATGSGFTAHGTILSHLVRPDGSEYPEMQLKADARGDVSHLVRIILIQTGTYEIEMVDTATKAVATSRFMVVEGPVPPVPAEARKTPDAYTGVWQGSVTSQGAPPQMVLVSLSGGETGGVVGTIAYPGLSCGGEVWLLGVSGDGVQLGEQITYGEERCDGRGIVAVKAVADGSLEFQRRDTRHPATAPAVGTLPRRQ